VTGLPDGYCAKVLSRNGGATDPRGKRRFGLISLGPVLAGLGLKLAVIEDEEILARFAPLREPRDKRTASNRWSRADGA